MVGWVGFQPRDSKAENGKPWGWGRAARQALVQASGRGIAWLLNPRGVPRGIAAGTGFAHTTRRWATSHAMRTSREREVDTTVEGAPNRFSAAGIRLKDIDRIPMVIRHQRWPWPADSIQLFGRDAQAKRHDAQVVVDVYPLPGGTEEFEKGFAGYRKRKRAFLVEGSKFDESLLLPRRVSADHERETFQVRDGIHRRRIVHVFRSPGQAVVLAYSLNSAHFASSVFFRRVSESMAIGTA